MPYQCSYCGGYFCSEHRLPEEHDCPGLKDDYWNVPVKVKRKRRVDVHKVNIPLPKPSGIAAYGYNNLIIGICTIMFFLSIILPVERFLALHPSYLFVMPWQIVTCIFLHGSFDHYLVNMIVLLFFGSELERRAGGNNYLKIFFLSGIAGNLAYLLFAYSTGELYPALGASGAIYGIMGTLAIIAPEIRVLFFFMIPMGIRTALLLFAAYDLFMLPFSAQTGVAHAAHLAGLLVGLYYGKKLRILRRWRMW